MDNSFDFEAQFQSITENLRKEERFFRRTEAATRRELLRAWGLAFLGLVLCLVALFLPLGMPQVATLSLGVALITGQVLWRLTTPGGFNSLREKDYDRWFSEKESERPFN